MVAGIEARNVAISEVVALNSVEGRDQKVAHYGRFNFRGTRGGCYTQGQP
jgi:hypothetical protein